MASTTDLPIPIPSSVSSVPWIGIAKTAGGLFASVAAVLAAVVLRTAGYLLIAATWLLSSTYSVAAWPVARLLDILRVLLSPVTYTLSYTLIPLNAVLGFLARLRLGSAAFIGILAGLVLKFASDYIVVVLSLDSDKERAGSSDVKSYTASGSASKTTSSSYTTATSAQTGTTITTPSNTTTASTSQLPKIEDNKSDIVQDDVWQWLEEFNPRQPAVAVDSSNNFTDAPSPLQRQRPPGLLSLTILEESSSEGGNS
ncbi:hypothetical protein F503_07436 [Ophiostoma piceae UAMH 11346]|uniref:Uncharacterized protein n=1 Tax=Ophiostoma piceae (strain UAMH 11346) TaxID=1262450 RepID=S3D895_OPHP1|nr:hypothetical protein F503_07436 [Ophiostoma piceae UAMH 11346]